MSKTLIWIGKVLVTIVLTLIVDKILTKAWHAWKNFRTKNQVQEESAV